MKKLIIIAAMTTAFTSVSTSASNGGTLTFTGNLTSATCNVVVNGAGTGDSTVTLPTLSTAKLAAAGDVAGQTTINMVVSNCTGATAGQQMNAYFESGASVDVATGRLKNTAVASAASNVQLQLLDKDGSTPIVAGSTSQTTANQAIAVPTTGNTATLHYGVQYYATGTTTAGVVSSNVVYSINYK